jgi:hypothetical protein
MVSRFLQQEKVEAMKRMAKNGMGIVLLLGLAGMPAVAQNQSSSSAGQSLGDYARQIRKEPDAKAKPKVFDNDNLPKNDKLSIVGAPAAPPSEQSDEAKAEQSKPEESTADGTKAGGQAKPAADKAAAQGATKAPDDEAAKQAAIKQWSDKLNAQKQQIDLLGRELDVVQREYQIRAAAMYADAGNRLRNQTDWDKQDAQYKQQIADKQKSLEDAKQKLADLQEEARRAGMPNSVLEQ